MKALFSCFLAVFLSAASLAAAQTVPVEPCPEELETVWAVEDSHTEAGNALLTAMTCSGMTAGYDADSRTFYCPIGTENGAAWPDLEFTAEGADGVQAVFCDDYAYDDCGEAVENGYSYELFAWDDSTYGYYHIVFTGLPVVCISCTEELTDTYQLCSVTAADLGETAVSETAGIHLRGGPPSETISKKSYRIEFRETDDPDEKKKVPLFSMKKDTDWILRANEVDPTAVRDHLNWNLWKLWKGDDAVPALESCMVELFLNDSYCGVYELLSRIRPKKCLPALGGDLSTDVCARIIHMNNLDSDRPNRAMSCSDVSYLQLRYTPEGMTEDDAFALLSDYDLLNLQEEGALSDEDFLTLMHSRFDVRELLEYFCFTQAFGFGVDNVRNNVYIWVLMSDSGYTYHLTPWDMDRSWEHGDGIHAPYCISRLLDLDMDSRRILHEVWTEKKALYLDSGAAEAAMTAAEEQMVRSGAFLRESEKWRGEARYPDFSEMYDFLYSRAASLDAYFEEVWSAE